MSFAKRLAAATVLMGVAVLTLPAVAAEHTIVLDKMKFGPAPAGLRVGDTILWRNDDILHHSATARDGSFDLDLPSKGQAALVLKTAGRVDFYCKFHPGMTGTLVIKP